MALRINTNVSSIAAQHQLGRSQRTADGAMKALASGSRFDMQGNSSANFGVAENLRGQIRGLQSARMNAENAISFVQVAEGGLNEQSNILIRMRELAIQSASDNFSNREREYLDSEYQALASELDRIAKTTSFGSTSLLDGNSKQYEFQVGAYKGENNIIRYKSDTDTTLSALSLSGSAVDGKSDARSALEDIDDAMNSVTSARAKFGAIQSRLESTVNNSAVQAENLTAAHSRLADTDIAEATSEMYKAKALQQYQLQVLAHANQFPANVVRIIA